MSELVQTNMSKLVQIQYDTNCYKTWRNTLKLSKWHEENSHWRKAIPWIASSKSSDQKDAQDSDLAHFIGDGAKVETFDI